MEEKKNKKEEEKVITLNGYHLHNGTKYMHAQLNIYMCICLPYLILLILMWLRVGLLDQLLLKDTICQVAL